MQTSKESYQKAIKAINETIIRLESIRAMLVFLADGNQDGALPDASVSITSLQRAHQHILTGNLLFKLKK